MGLPLLKDFLPENLGGALHAPVPAPGPELRSQASALESFERELQAAEGRTLELRRSLEAFLARTRELLPNLSEEDVVHAFEEIIVEEARHLPVFTRHLDEARRERSAALSWAKTPLKSRALQLFDRQIRALESALEAFEWSKDQLELLRDAVLVREAQELSAGAFWGGDDP